MSFAWGSGSLEECYRAGEQFSDSGLGECVLLLSTSYQLSESQVFIFNTHYTVGWECTGSAGTRTTGANCKSEGFETTHTHKQRTLETRLHSYREISLSHTHMHSHARTHMHIHNVMIRDDLDDT